LDEWVLYIRPSNSGDGIRRKFSLIWRGWYSPRSLWYYH